MDAVAAFMDATPDTVFWPLFALVCLVLTFLALWAYARMVDRSNPKRSFREWDGVAERRRHIERRGFRTWTGTR